MTPRLLLPTRILDQNVGGNTTYTRALARGMAKRGWDIERIPAAGNPVATILSESAFALRSHQSAVLHFSADTGPMFRTRTPSAVTVHGIASRWTSVARSRSQETVWRTRVARAIASTDRVVTVSQSSADDVSTVFGVDRNKIAIIPHGIDVDEFRAASDLSDEVAKCVPPEFALYVGNIEPRKNIFELVKAFETLDIPLVIAGRYAWNFEPAKSAIENSSNVIYLGFISNEDRRALMQRCSLFVFPSHYEGFGFPVLEAMAAGAPVLCSNRGSLAEVAGPARRLEGLDREAIRAGVLASLDDAAWRSGYATEAAGWVEKFSWERSIAAHTSIYEDLLTARR